MNIQEPIKRKHNKDNYDGLKLELEENLTTDLCRIEDAIYELKVLIADKENSPF